MSYSDRKRKMGDKTTERVFSEICDIYYSRQGLLSKIASVFRKTKPVEASTIRQQWLSAVKLYDFVAQLSSVSKINESFREHINLGECRKIFRNEKIGPEMCFLVFKDVFDAMSILGVSTSSLSKVESFGWLACLTQNFWQGGSKCSTMVCSLWNIDLVLQACRLFESQFSACKIDMAGMLRKYGNEKIADSYETAFGVWLDEVRIK